MLQGISYEVTSDDNDCTKDDIPVNETSKCVPGTTSIGPTTTFERSTIGRFCYVARETAMLHVRRI